MASSRVFWLSFLVLGITNLLHAAIRLRSSEMNSSILAMGIGGLGLLVVAGYAVLQPDAVQGPDSDSPVTYVAVLAAVLTVVGFALTL